MRLTSSIVLLTLTILSAAFSLAADSPLFGPDGFAFIGKWNCDGHIPANGKNLAHHVLYEGKMVSDGKWIEFSQKDIEPAGYDADFLTGYDPVKKEIFAFVGDNRGYAMLAGPGWQGRSLRLTMTGQASYKGFSIDNPLPISRVTYEVKSADEFTVLWGSTRRAEVERGRCLDLQAAKRLGISLEGNRNIFAEARLLTEMPSSQASCYRTTACRFRSSVAWMRLSGLPRSLQ